MQTEIILVVTVSVTLGAVHPWIWGPASASPDTRGVTPPNARWRGKETEAHSPVSSVSGRTRSPAPDVTASGSGRHKPDTVHAADGGSGFGETESVARGALCARH